MKKRSLILAVLLGTGCAPQAPAPTGPGLVTLATFEGEMDMDAGTFTIRTTGVPSGTPPANGLVIPTGASTVTIANTGTIQRNVSGTGGCTGQSVMMAPVQIALGYPSPGFAGGLYAELQTLSGTGAEACNSATPPTGSGLLATKGLWSYGTVRPGTTTSDVTWQFKWTTAQKTTFTGRVVGVPGTSFATTLTNNPNSLNNSYSPLIAYTRTWSTGVEGVAYASGQSALLVYLGLDGASLGTPLVTPAVVNSLAAHEGATASDDILWFTTDSRVGVVYRGTVYSELGGSTGLSSVAVDPGVANRAWFVSRTGTWFRSVDFDTTGHGFTLGNTVTTPNAPYSIVLRTRDAPATGTWAWVSYNAATGWIKAWDTGSLTLQATLDFASTHCEGPYTLILGPDQKLWYQNCPAGLSCGFCSYDPGTATFTRVPVSFSGGSLGVARYVTGAGNGVWGVNVLGGSSVAPYVHQAVQVVEGATSTSMFTVDLPDSAAFAGYPGSVPTLCGSPAVGVHPAYLWWTSDRAIYRLQPQ